MGLGTRPEEPIHLGIEPRPSAPPPPPPLSTDVQLKALVSLLTALGGDGMVFCATALAVLSTWVACNQYSLLSSWRRTDAEIVTSAVYSEFLQSNTRSQTRPSPIFGFHCTVRFQANGRPYESQADIGYKKSARSEMIDWYQRFSSGRHTTIAYDPGNPSRVKLAEDFQTSYAAPLATLGYAGWLLLFGLPMVLISGKLRRQQQRNLESDPADSN
ncbi:MAG TPA: DUF3592 domain-containing protein [Terriglobales bacterium]|jgi:hypothetical protein|nr:DUF3592 domain-containing protein [Terriglobales bacterium]